MIQLLYPFATGADVRQHLLDTKPVNNAQPFAADAQSDPALLVFQPEPSPMQIGHKAPLGLVIGMRHVVPDQWPLAGDLTDL